MFLSLWWRSRWPLTISSPSIPTQTTVTCGLPSLFRVVTCASGPVLMRFRTDSGIVIVFLSEECSARTHSPRTPKTLVHAFYRVSIQRRELVDAETFDSELEVETGNPKRLAAHSERKYDRVKYKQRTNSFALNPPSAGFRELPSVPCVSETRGAPASGVLAMSNCVIGLSRSGRKRTP